MAAVGDQVAGERGNRGTENNEESAKVVTIEIIYVGDRKRSSAQANDDEGEDRSFDRPFSQLGLDESTWRACDSQNTLAWRHRWSLVTFDLLSHAKFVI
jgi:hypothetical protein